MIPLTALRDRLAQVGLLAETQGTIDDIQVNRLASDSRAVAPGALFVAVRGSQTDGHLFIDKAVQNEAIAIVGEAFPAFVGAPRLQVHDSTKALAHLAAAFHGDPADALTMVGVTGTNGKTTTATLIQYLLRSLGANAGRIGTTGYDAGRGVVDTTHTTPDIIELHRILAEMVENDCTACAMEVSSHALAQGRVHGIDYAAGVFTNLTRDHLDYHGSFADYLAAKKLLFDGLSSDATAIYNVDDAASFGMTQGLNSRFLSYGQDVSANLRFEILANRIDGLRLRLDGREQAFRLVGAFNAYNLVAAYGVGLALGYGADDVLAALAEALPVDGRFEQIGFADGTTVIVDYAHTPDALENVLQTIRATMPEDAKLWTVFGCGGDRDPAKRQMMGGIAERYSDTAIVTSDNPRTEDPASILAAIREGMTRPNEAISLVDRRDAIDEAARQAAPGDVVLVAGKGHETYQIIGTEKRHFDDREEVRRAFAKRGAT
ncbi:MAG: UDP-N-acetylmuramoyl-L-alanyl-D-glutamate--2,6-diaminopimelate ligase [Rhodothermales bacterium]